MWLLEDLVLWFIETERIKTYRPRRNQQSSARQLVEQARKLTLSGASRSAARLLYPRLGLGLPAARSAICTVGDSSQHYVYHEPYPFCEPYHR